MIASLHDSCRLGGNATVLLLGSIISLKSRQKFLVTDHDRPRKVMMSCQLFSKLLLSAIKAHGLLIQYINQCYGIGIVKSCQLSIKHYFLSNDRWKLVTFQCLACLVNQAGSFYCLCHFFLKAQTTSLKMTNNVLTPFSNLFCQAFICLVSSGLGATREIAVTRLVRQFSCNFGL